jgi:hypothetical protein
MERSALFLIRNRRLTPLSERSETNYENPVVVLTDRVRRNWSPG